MSSIENFLAGANQASALALMPAERVPDDIPMVILVVEDSEDDELVSLLASVDSVPAAGYGGAWAAGARQDDGLLIIKFLLVRLGGGWERAWVFPNPPADILDAIAAGPHYVTILPRELAGDLTAEYNERTIAGSMIVGAQASDAVQKIREALAG